MAITEPELAAALKQGAAVLVEAGIDSATAEMRELAAFAMGVDASQVSTTALLGAKTPATLDQLVSQRAQRIPLQHITGRAYFRHLQLDVGPGVFVPRPETETVVQIALDWLAHQDMAKPVVVDLCAGSGAIAASIAQEHFGAEVYAVELSEQALPFLQKNAGAVATVVHGDAASALSALNSAVDVVISNPPYIPDHAVPIQQEARDHDPAMALYGGGGDGLHVPAQVAVSAARLLRPGGFFVMEHAEVQRESIPELLASIPGAYTGITGHQDLTGKPRSTSALRAVQ